MEETSKTNIFGQWLLHILTMCGHFYALCFNMVCFVENDEISLMKFICVSGWPVWGMGFIVECKILCFVGDIF